MNTQKQAENKHGQALTNELMIDRVGAGPQRLEVPVVTCRSRVSRFDGRLKAGSRSECSEPFDQLMPAVFRSLELRSAT